MTTPARACYTGYRFPAEIIGHAVWLYFRFPFGLRMVEELLTARGIIVTTKPCGSARASSPSGSHGQVMALPPGLRLNFEDGPGWENRDSIARCPADVKAQRRAVRIGSDWPGTRGFRQV